MHEICEGDKINNNFGGDDVAPFEESEIRSSKDYVNYNDDLVSAFYAYTCLGNNIYEILIMRKKLLMRILMLGSTLIKMFGRGGP